MEVATSEVRPTACCTCGDEGEAGLSVIVSNVLPRTIKLDPDSELNQCGQAPLFRPSPRKAAWNLNQYHTVTTCAL